MSEPPYVVDVCDTLGVTRFGAPPINKNLCDALVRRNCVLDVETCFGGDEGTRWAS